MRATAPIALILVALLTLSAVAEDGVTVRGRVRSSKGKAIASADVLVAVKSWPGGRFTMNHHHAKTDAKGEFSLQILDDAAAKHEFNVAVVADGYLLESRYVTEPGSFDFQPKLAVGHPVTVRFVDERGKPVKGVTAWAGGRDTADGVKHTVFPQRTEPIRKRSDKKGEIRFRQFAKGDRAKIFEMRSGGGWEMREFTVEGKKNEIVVLRPKGAMPDEDLRAGKDEKKRFFLVGPKADEKKPEEGYGLLLVMAGGDGGEGFRGFARDIFMNSAPPGCVLAHLVSVKWTPEQETVWPTKRGRIKGAKFTTEEFIDAVVKEVKSRHEIDKRRIYTLSWSSSGPAAYAAAFRKKTPITGSLVTMSVFYRAWFPNVKPARGRPFYILHSPTDATCEFRLAEDARDRLKKVGAKVEFKTYEGGHGWPPATRFKMIEDGFRWLDEQTTR